MKVLGKAQLREKGITYHGSHLWRLVRDGLFPKPIHIGPNRVAWIEAEVDEWLRCKINERDSAPAKPRTKKP